MSLLGSERHLGECRVFVARGSVPVGTLTSDTDIRCRQDVSQLKNDM